MLKKKALGWTWDLMFELPTTLCRGEPYLPCAWEWWGDVGKTRALNDLGGPREDSLTLGACDPKRMVVKSNPFGQLMGRSSWPSSLPPQWLQEAGYPNRFPFPCCPWPGLLPTSALRRSHQTMQTVRQGLTQRHFRAGGQ